MKMRNYAACTACLRRGWSSPRAGARSPARRPRGHGASCFLFTPSLNHHNGGVYEKRSSAFRRDRRLYGTGAQAADPEYKNECTMGLATKKHIPTDCSVTWKSENGKTYCFGNEEAKRSSSRTRKATSTRRRPSGRNWKRIDPEAARAVPENRYPRLPPDEISPALYPKG